VIRTPRPRYRLDRAGSGEVDSGSLGEALALAFELAARR
jgi:hypothetical protein